MRMEDIEIIEVNGKKVPVKKSKELVCSGKFEVKGDRLSSEDIRSKIIELAIQSGNYQGDGTDLEVSYDVDGNYKAFVVTKTPLSYEEALEAYQKSFDMEEEIRDQFGAIDGAPQEEYDKLREKLSRQQEDTEVYAERITDAYEELHQKEAEDIAAYYERYGLMEASTVDEIAAKLDEAEQKGLITKEGADNVFVTLARIREIRDEIEEHKQEIRNLVDHKKLLVEEDGAKEDSVRGYDESVRQLNEEIRRLEDELNGLIRNLPPVTVKKLSEEKIEEEPVKKDSPAEVENKKNLPAVQYPKVDFIEGLGRRTTDPVVENPEKKNLPAVQNPQIDFIRELERRISELSDEDIVIDKKPEKTTKQTPEGQETAEESYDELVDLRSKLDKVTDNAERLKLLKELIEKTEKLEKTLSRTTDLEEFRNAILLMDDQIIEIEEELRKAVSEYEKSYEKLRDLMIEQNKKLNTDEPLTDEDYKRITDEYIQKKLQENAHSDYVRRTIEEYKKQLASLKRRKNALEKDLKEAAALGLSAQEYREITEVMRKRNLINAVLESKGLKEIVEIPASKRTKEQQKQLDDARKEIRREIARHQAGTKEEVSVLDSIEILYHVDPKVYQARKPRKTTMSKKDIDAIKRKAEEAEVIKIKNPKEDQNNNNNKETLKAPEDMLEVNKIREASLNSEQRRGLIDRITIFTDTNTGKKYTRKYVFERFNIVPQSEEVRINGAVCFELFEDDLSYIMNNANNEISPYEVVSIELDLEKQKQLVKKQEEKKNLNNENNSSKEEIAKKINEELEKFDKEEIEDYSFIEKEKDKITLYYDLDNNEIYANESVFARFNLEELGEAVIIDGEPCYRMTQQDALDIDDNKDNEVSPYDLEVRNVHLGKRKQEEQDDEIVLDDEAKTKEEENLNSRPGLTDKITLFRDLDNDGLIYVRKNVLTRFNIMESGVDVRINGALCYPISDEDAEYIKRNQDNDYSPYIVDEVDIHLGQKGLIPVEEKTTEVVPVERREIVIYVDKEDNDQLYTSEEVLTNFSIGFDGDSTVIDGVNTHPIDRGTDAFLNGIANSSTNPKYEVVYKEITLKKEKPEEKEDKPKEITLTLYRDINDNGQLYASLEILNRFDITPDDKITRNILGKPCQRISLETDQVINQKAGESKDPIIKIEYRDIKLKKKKKKEPQQEEIVLTLFRDVNDNGQLYASLDILNRFNIIPMNKEIFKVEGLDCNKITPEVDKMINLFAKDSTNPKIRIEYKDVELTKTKGSEEEITLTLYRDINDNGQLYASTDILNRFGITLEDKTITNILGHDCMKISIDIDRTINRLARESKNPKINIEYVDVKLKKKESERKRKPHLEEIIFKLTDGLDIRSGDAKKYQARNIKVAKQFSDELHSGNYLYNIVHLVPATMKLLFGGSRKLFHSIFTSGRGREVMTELARRVNALTDEELEVLFTEYRGSVLKTDMNNQINPLILGRLREYGMRKVQKLNALIGQNYEELFAYLSQIKAIDEQLRKGHIGEAERQALENTRADLLHKSSTNVKNILKARKEANELLSGGIHGLEEDFKAVSTKLSYVGMRFGKNNDFDNELQAELAGYGRQLNDGLDKENDQDIVDGFVGMEKTFAKNTQIKGSLYGKRSVGQKYYTPLAEVLDYRDDPFIRDLFTTIAVTTAVVSAVNAIRVHQIEQGGYVDAKNQEIADANAVNDQTAANVRQQGQTITGHSDTYREGMAAQQRQDVLGAANTSERASLDTTGWKFGDQYRQLDDASHAMYNQFGEQVTQRANDIATRYGQGVIDQQTALREMAQLSADSQSTLLDVVNSSLPILRQYAQTHPQFDLHAVEEAMQYIAAHPDAIANMNDATLEIMEIGEALQGVTAAHVSALSALPSDMATTLIAAATATAMAGRICATMEDGMRKGKYGNQVTEMMDEYIEQEEEAEDEHHRTR